MAEREIIEVKITDMLDDGRAFGRHEGCAVFVVGKGGAASAEKASGGVPAGAVPGDTVRAEIRKSGKSSKEAVMTELIEASPERIAAECPYFGECGGCTLQELAYDAQLKMKTEQVRSKLTRLGGLTEPKVNDMIAAETLKYYRNKATFAVGPHGEVGFKKAKSHFVMDIDDCILQCDAAMVCADALRTFLKDNADTVKPGRDIKEMTVKTAFGTGEVMVVLEGAKKEIPGIELLCEMLDDAVYSVNENSEEISEEENSDKVSLTDELLKDDVAFSYSLESVAVIYGAGGKEKRAGKCEIIAGKPTITDEVIKPDGTILKFEIGPQSFYQVNPEQMVKLYDIAEQYAIGKSKTIGTLLDIYCGVGTIGIWMAGKAEQVIGIESVKSAVIDANRNSVINGLINTRYICGKAEEELPGMMGLAKLYKWNEVNERVEREPEITIKEFDVAVLDPPRAGCGEALLAAVTAAQPRRIVYISCDPGTLARDIKYLTAHGYDFIEATPVDQFPWTSHVETVCLMSRVKE